MIIEKRQSFEKKYYVGVSTVTLLGVNPTAEQINKWKNYTPDEEPKEIEYIKSVDYKYKDRSGEDQEKTVDQLTIDIYVQDTKTKEINKITYYLIHELATNKGGDKEVWINQFGMSSYVPNEFDLATWFTSKTVKDKYDSSLTQTFSVNHRRAFVGEKDLFEFLAAYVDINQFNVSNSIFFEDEKSFWKGNVKELNSLIEQFSGQTVIVCYEIKSKDSEDGIKEFQVINNRTFCAGRFMRNFNNYLKSDFSGLETDKKNYNLNQFVKKLKNPENTKNYFEICEAKLYDGNQNPANSNEAIINPTTSNY